MWRASSRSFKPHGVPAPASLRFCCTYLERYNAGAEKGGDAGNRSLVKEDEQMGRFSIEVLKVYNYYRISGLPKSAVQMQSMKEASPSIYSH